MQQLCGVNVIAYYSSAIFVDSGFQELNALAASLGFGIINFLFALPAVYTIDSFGRRNLLLFTFPLMALFLLFTGFSFWIPGDTARIACVALGIYLFAVVYSPGEGPVPFTYSAEAYPLYLRTYGMSLATATTWVRFFSLKTPQFSLRKKCHADMSPRLFNFILSLTFPSLLVAFKPQGAFSFYAAWNLIGWVGVLLLVPETKSRSLEELDAVFSVSTRAQMRHGMQEVPYFFKKYVLRRKGVELAPLIDFEAAKREGEDFDRIVREEGK